MSLLSDHQIGRERRERLAGALAALERATPGRGNDERLGADPAEAQPEPTSTIGALIKRVVSRRSTSVTARPKNDSRIVGGLVIVSP